MTKTNSEQQAELQLANIKQAVERLRHSTGECEYDKLECNAGAKGGETYDNAIEYHDDDKAREAVEHDALSVEVRTGWYTPIQKAEVSEYQILLAWGGPAVKICGQLEDNQPVSATLQYQDWGTEWTDLDIDSEAEDALISYAQCFYFGEF